MPTFAEKLFDFTQRRQAMALDQARFAEAKRQFNITSDLSRIQTEQNARRLDQYDNTLDFQRADARVGRDIQQQGIDLSKRQQSEAERAAKTREYLIQIGEISAGRASGALGPAPEGVSIAPVSPEEQAKREIAIKEEQVDKIFGRIDGLNTSKTMKELAKMAVMGASGPATAAIQAQQGGSAANELNRLKAAAFGAPEIRIAASKQFLKDLQDGLFQGDPNIRTFNDLPPENKAVYLSSVANDMADSIKQRYPGVSPDVLAGIAFQDIVKEEQSAERISKIGAGANNIWNSPLFGGGMPGQSLPGQLNQNLPGATVQSAPTQPLVAPEPTVQLNPEVVPETIQDIPPEEFVGPQQNRSLLSAISEIMSSFAAPEATARGELPINLESTFAPQLSKFAEAQRTREARRRAYQQQLELRRQSR